ncbi:hypothetical protein MMC09_006331 [Bachmanniomyces sp. S44760]|nr:hypothetical protein [Bachmanniomyces sp. S44760]
MDSFLLPATVYEAPSRQARTQVQKHQLNTIIEDVDDDSLMLDDGDRRSRRRARSPASSRSQSRSMSSCSPVPSLTSSRSSYNQHRGMAIEFDELYDVSDVESDQDLSTPRVFGRPPRAYRNSTSRDSWSSAGSRNRYPSLQIPSPRHWPTVDKHKVTSPVPPTPPPKIPISPAALSLLEHGQTLSTGTPSLDGSLASDQIACSTAPPTPDLLARSQSLDEWGRPTSTGLRTPHEGDDLSHVEIRLDEHVAWLPREDYDDQEEPYSALITTPDSPVLGSRQEWPGQESGVELPADALNVLQHISQDYTTEPASAIEPRPVQEMQEIYYADESSPCEQESAPPSATSEYSISQLSIPSPGGFFSSLNATAQHTWCSPKSALPPSSTTAEHFYNAPWNTRLNSGEGRIVERILEVDDTSTVGQLTATQAPTTAMRIPLVESRSTSTETVVQAEPLHRRTSYDEVKEIQPERAQSVDDGYDPELWQLVPESSMDRTSSWLAEQTSYMAALRETNPINSESAPNSAIDPTPSDGPDALLDSPMQKAVNSLAIDTAKAAGEPTKSDPLFYQAFQHTLRSTSPPDSFIHRQTRFDALQANRNNLPQEHLDSLMGNYRVTDSERPSPQRPISTFPGNSDTAEETTEQRVMARVDKERQAMEQVKSAMWIVEASKYLCGGNLLNSPAASILDRVEKTSPKTPGHGSKSRVLDLGGQARCDWAWHCAQEYPHISVYTASTDPHSHGPKIRGPTNHRLVSVDKLWELPFPDNHFDAISARSLFMLLKNGKPLGVTVDEYDMCLRECGRCLKPGGFLEYFLLDSEIMHSGPRGTAVSVEFGFNLKARGYDSAPTKSWLGRLRRAGFVDIKRAWMYLPMGSSHQDAMMSPPETPPPTIASIDDKAIEAIQGPVGSTGDAANISGLVGSWTWEQWMLKLQLETGKEHLLEGVGAVLEEGRASGAGWRCLSGWARKPL